jgi:hypothetical protein
VQEQIKSLITSLMLNAPPPVRAQLSEALTIISGHDFPSRWQVGQDLAAASTHAVKVGDVQLIYQGSCSKAEPSPAELAAGAVPAAGIRRPSSGQWRAAHRQLHLQAVNSLCLPV